MITIECIVNAHADKAWLTFVKPEHITNWNFADVSWHCPSAENDVRAGGKFRFHMAAKDGSAAFDFEGEYTEVHPGQSLSYKIADGRKVLVKFSEENGRTKITESFEPENIHSEELQRGGWQAILNNYKNYTENL